MGQLLERLERQKSDGFEHDLIELFRMVPTRTAAIYFAREELLRVQQSCARFRAEVLHEAEKQILKLYRDVHLCDLPELTRERNAIWYEEIIVPLIEALESKDERDLILCVRNGDSIRDLAEDASVEVPVKISRRGVKPRAVGDTPRFLRGFFASVKESDRLTIEAVRHKSSEFALQALAINPFVPSLSAARAFLDRVAKEESLELH
jgi:6-phospho-beta-glucosidase